MILDALLKTKSRVVLTDIINKNGNLSQFFWWNRSVNGNLPRSFLLLGLRMLHNIMKQYRSDFKKIPILRKLLKVILLMEVAILSFVLFFFFFFFNAC